MWNMFITNEYSWSFELDGMTTSHSIKADVQTSDEADEVFDAISYCKCASVIRMLQGYLVEEIFRQGLIKYSNNFRYSNAIATDLWNYLGKQKGIPVATIMSSWTIEQGFPVVSASRNGDKLILIQIRHLSSRKLTPEQVRF
ncbi:hypothetical protein RFI_29125 [Reticulomyxa filosa]|uniref:Peptidase M1 membrane alanine aminopeptidase domain-containing protein n=1 Tax=Reticulomyxa filosa TaxID=46433 RepID=X6M5G0_RETFI|nr:hypothetical protein RFI_29125 [Reticulomyxa filosa]|eukprot:ETO08265.1 hypothetical protein RFI_29125 [Reticulomyxa filosa]